MNKYKNPAIKKNLGMSLLEIMIVVAASVIISLFVYGFYQMVFASQRGMQESLGATQLTDSIVRSYDSLPNFTTVNSKQVIDDNLLPKGFSSNGSTIYSPTGLVLSVSSETIQGINGRGFALTYQNVSSKTCTDLASGALPMQRFTSITVGDTDVVNGGVLDEQKVVTACNNAPTTVKLVYKKGAAGNISNLEECQLPMPNPETRERSCDTGYIGKIIEKRTASCLGPYELPT